MVRLGCTRESERVWRHSEIRLPFRGAENDITAELTVLHLTRSYWIVNVGEVCVGSRGSSDLIEWEFQFQVAFPRDLRRGNQEFRPPSEAGTRRHRHPVTLVGLLLLWWG